MQPGCREELLFVQKFLPPACLSDDCHQWVEAVLLPLPVYYLVCWCSWPSVNVFHSESCYSESISWCVCVCKQTSWTNCSHSLVLFLFFVIVVSSYLWILKDFFSSSSICVFFVLSSTDICINSVTPSDCSRCSDVSAVYRAACCRYSFTSSLRPFPLFRLGSLSWEKTLQLRSRELLSCLFPKYISIKYVNLSLTYWTIFDHVGINKCHITIFSLDILLFFFLSFISCKEWRTYDFESISL